LSKVIQSVVDPEFEEGVPLLKRWKIKRSSNQQKWTAKEIVNVTVKLILVLSLRICSGIQYLPVFTTYFWLCAWLYVYWTFYLYSFIIQLNFHDCPIRHLDHIQCAVFWKSGGTYALCALHLICYLFYAFHFHFFIKAAMYHNPNSQLEAIE